MADPQRCVILDRDGVINHDSDEYIKSPEEWRPIPGSLEAIASLVSAGLEIVVVTNQSGIGRGLISETDLQRIHEKMRRAVEAAGGHLTAVYYCPHTPNEGCDCRKPATGMLRRMERELGYPLEETPLVGDKPSDIELARAVGARPILVRTGYGSETEAAISDPLLEVFDDLAQVSRSLLTEPPS